MSWSSSLALSQQSGGTVQFDQDHIITGGNARISIIIYLIYNLLLPIFFSSSS